MWGDGGVRQNFLDDVAQFAACPGRTGNMVGVITCPATHDFYDRVGGMTLFAGGGEMIAFTREDPGGGGFAEADAGSGFVGGGGGFRAHRPKGLGPGDGT